MSTLDDPRKIIDPINVSVWPTAMRYGGTVGLVLVVIGLLMHLTGMSDPSGQNATSTAIGCLNYVIIMVAVVLAIKHHRDNELGGYLTLGRGMGVGTATALVIGAISAVWTILMMTLIAPEMGEMIKEQALENAQPGAEEMTEKMVGLFTNPFTMALFVLLVTVFLGFITALIAGAIMKKDAAPNI